MGPRRRPFALLSLCCSLGACGGQAGSDDPKAPSETKQTPDEDGATPPASSPDAPDTPDAPGSNLPTGSCEALEGRWKHLDRKLERACETKADCTLLWSDYNCYALHGPKDVLAELERVDQAMAHEGCAQVECEPPPLIACEAGTCDWDL